MTENNHSRSQLLHFSLVQRSLNSILRDLEACRRLIDSTGQDTIGEDKIVAELEAFELLLSNTVLDEVEHGLYLLRQSEKRDGPLRQE